SAERRKRDGRPRSQLFDRADPSGGVAAARTHHAERRGLRARRFEIGERNLRQQHTRRARETQTGRRGAIRRRSVLQLCGERPMNNSSQFSVVSREEAQVDLELTTENATNGSGKQNARDYMPQMQTAD